MSAPLIVVGPMVRRVDSGSATVFLVLREAKDVTLSVLRQDGSLVMSGQRRTIKLGENLYAVAVTARSKDALSWGETYHYDLEFADIGDASRKQGLYDNDVLVSGPAFGASALERLVYEGERLPSFVLPQPELGRVRVLHGSCRKPHGYGRDSMRRADELLAAAFAGKQERAQMFFMTGDQIYADDVDGELIQSLVRYAKETRGDGVHGVTRRALVKNAGFTSTAAENHLVSLGEYIAMYVFTHSQWPWYGKPKTATVASFYGDIPYARRFWANTPTYMIFDDHEVTDDWFLTRGWADRVLGDALGRKVLRHGLLAYAVFQHWGNVPDMFEPHAPGGKLLALLDDWHASDASRIDAIDALLGLSRRGADLEKEKPQSIQWGYRVEGPSFEAIVLDTRMRRNFEPSDGRTSLCSKAHLERELGTRSAPAFSIVVSATPMLGLSRVETLQSIAATIGLEPKFDVECWARSSTHRRAIELLLARSPAVVLSGDVHFGLAAQVVERGANPRCVVNFTSSAFKNAPATWWERQGLAAAGGTTLRDLNAFHAEVAPKIEQRAPLTIEEQTWEETLLVSGADPSELLAFAAPHEAPLEAPREASRGAPEEGAPVARAVPHAHTIATPWTNLGEIYLDVPNQRIVQRMHYDRNGTWQTREDSSTFPLR